MMQRCGSCKKEWVVSSATQGIEHKCYPDATEIAAKCGCTIRITLQENTLNPCLKHSPIDRTSEVGNMISALKNLMLVAVKSWKMTPSDIELSRWYADRIRFGRDVLLKLEKDHELDHWSYLDKVKEL